MKKITFGGMTLILAAFFGMMVAGSPTAFARSTAVAQRGKTQQTQHVQLPNESPANMALYNTTQVFLGTVTKQDGHYVLTAGQLTYKLNDQSKVQKYNGEQVQIIGKLNPKTNKIKVKKIKKANY